jgi:alkylated DNA repair dioxygenase AlkB
MQQQADLFETASPYPAGFRYAPEFISAAEEQRLVEHLRRLEFKPFEFQGFLGKRRIVSFGWRYDFSGGGLHKIDDMPDFLLPLRERAGAFAGLPPTDLQQVLLTEYQLGAPIGWHKDRPVFGDVVGVRSCPPASSVSAAKQPPAGSAARWCSRHARLICCAVPPAPPGSTTSPP